MFNQRSKRFLALTGVFSAVLEDNFHVLLILLQPQKPVKRGVGIKCGNKNQPIIGLILLPLNFSILIFCHLGEIAKSSPR